MSHPSTPIWFPQAPGRCARCGRALLTAREASVEITQDRPRLVCRDAPGCLERSRTNHEQH